MQIKIIAVGSSKWDRFIRRWGVSFLIGEDVLFDTFGKLKVLLKNIKKFGVDITKIKHIVLSHDDWDHVSGLWHLLSNGQNITVHTCPGFNQELKDKIASFRVRVVEAKFLTEIKPDLFLSGQMQDLCAERCICEQALVIRSLKGLAIVTGCAHPGIVNIIRTVQSQFKEDKVYSILGGFHLKDNSDETNMGIIRELKDTGIHKILPMHCTGRRATKMMRGVFGYGFVKAREGDTVEL